MRGPQKAIVRFQNAEAEGRVDWKRNGWPAATYEVTSAKSDLGNEQQREKREERREKQEESDQPDEDERLEMAMVRSQKGGMVQKRVGPSGRGGQTLREERREKRVERERERYKHDQNERVAGGNGSIAHK